VLQGLDQYRSHSYDWRIHDARLGGHFSGMQVPEYLIGDLHTFGRLFR